MEKPLKKKENVYLVVVFFGALWGISEAALGYVLHLIPVPISGFFMYPIAFFFMYGAFKRTQDVTSIMGVGIVAALIKLVNLALPLLPAYHTLVPAATILLEASMLFIAYRVSEKMKIRPTLSGIVFASVSWRVLFLALQYVLYGASSYFFKSGTWVIVNFLLVEGLVNAGFLMIATRFNSINKKPSDRKHSIRPAFSYSILAVSIITTIAFSLL